jgi:hypothetical protein
MQPDPAMHGLGGKKELPPNVALRAKMYKLGLSRQESQEDRTFNLALQALKESMSDGRAPVLALALSSCFLLLA